ncbi:hypothetical protein GN244_ATG12213 [Phytophthora infestans]|uniref:Uncharacterized protein n=1 Tax=Phytophthora infestans TaxID=4787 RepID=A0A833SN88_PHYIN|nr:hypothetical protein GN244_ATG12213 [Phytophthora infestans]
MCPRPRRKHSRRGGRARASTKNTTAVLQPLDVGIMGPFKKKLRSLTLSYNLTSIQRNGSLPLRERLLALKRMSADEKSCL